MVRFVLQMLFKYFQLLKRKVSYYRLAKMHVLEVLSLLGNNLADSDMSTIGQLKSLKRLNMRKCQLRSLPHGYGCSWKMNEQLY